MGNARSCMYGKKLQTIVVQNSSLIIIIVSVTPVTASWVIATALQTYQKYASMSVAQTQKLKVWLATFMYSALENLYRRVEMNFGLISNAKLLTSSAGFFSSAFV